MFVEQRNTKIRATETYKKTLQKSFSSFFRVNFKLDNETPGKVFEIVNWR